MDNSIKIYICRDKDGIKCFKSDMPPVYDEHSQEFNDNPESGMYEWNDLSILDYLNIPYNENIKLGEYERVK